MRRLVVAAMIGALSLGSGLTYAAEEEAPATGAFSRTGSIAQARHVWQAAPLPDGRVVVFSGGCHANSAPSVEVWDPETDDFSFVARLAKGRCWYTATPLADGRVLILGGARANRDMSPGARVLDPATGSIKATARLDPPRIGHTATRLQDGRALVVGGSSSDAWHRPLASAQIWDQETEQFEPTGPMAHARFGHAAALLPDGRVLVVGGADDDRRRSAEVWDPVAGTFSPTGSLAHPRIEDYAALPLADGRVLITGGVDNDERPLPDEVWEPATGTFTITPAIVWSDPYSTATVLPDGRIVVIGGEDEFEGAEVWDPATWSSTPAGELIRSRGSHATTLLSDGRVLAVGGWANDHGGELASAEIWDPNGVPLPVSEEFERVGLPSVFGNQNEDGIIVLDDEGFCSYLLGGIWNRASIVPTELVLDQSDDEKVLSAAIDTNARYPASDEDLLASCVETLNRSRAAEADSLAPRWSIDHLVIPQAFEALIRDGNARDGAKPPDEPTSTSVLEMEMMLGVRQDLQGTCVPERNGLPKQTIAAVECRPRAGNVHKVRVYLFARQRDAMDAYFGRLAKAGVKLSKEHYPQLQGASFVDKTGQAHFLIPSPPLLFEVIGGGPNAARARRFAWLGNQDQPGGPTVCCGGGSPEK